MANFFGGNPCAAVDATGINGDARVIEHFCRLDRDGERRVRIGTRDEIALSIGYADVSQHHQLSAGFDAFGDHARAGIFGDLLDGLNEVQLHRIQIDALNEVHVDFDVFRAQFRPQAQTRKPLPQIVDGNLKADGAIVKCRFAQHRIIVGRLAFGQLDDEALRIQADALDEADGFVVPGIRLGETFRADIQE